MSTLTRLYLQGSGAIRVLFGAAGNVYRVGSLLDSQSRQAACEYELPGLPLPDGVPQCDITRDGSGGGQYTFTDGNADQATLYTAPTALTHSAEDGALYFFDGPALRVATLGKSRAGKRQGPAAQQVRTLTQPGGWTDPLAAEHAAVVPGGAPGPFLPYSPRDTPIAAVQAGRVTPFVGYSLLIDPNSTPARALLFLDPMCGLLRRVVLTLAPISTAVVASVETLIGTASDNYVVTKGAVETSLVGNGNAALLGQLAAGSLSPAQLEFVSYFPSAPGLGLEAAFELAFLTRGVPSGPGALLRTNTSESIADGQGTAGSLGFAKYLSAVPAGSGGDANFIVAGANTAPLTVGSMELGEKVPSTNCSALNLPGYAPGDTPTDLQRLACYRAVYFEAGSDAETAPWRVLPNADVGHPLMSHLRTIERNVVGQYSVVTQYPSGTTQHTSGGSSQVYEGHQIPSTHVVGIAALSADDIMMPTVGGEAWLRPDYSDVIRRSDLHTHASTHSSDTQGPGASLFDSTSEFSTASAGSRRRLQNAAAARVWTAPQAQEHALSFQSDPRRGVASPFMGALDVQEQWLDLDAWQDVADAVQYPGSLSRSSLRWVNQHTSFPVDGSEVAAQVMRWTDQEEEEGQWQSKNIFEPYRFTNPSPALTERRWDQQRSKFATVDFDGFVWVLGGNEVPQPRIWSASQAQRTNRLYVPGGNGDGKHPTGTNLTREQTLQDAPAGPSLNSTLRLEFKANNDNWAEGPVLNTPREDFDAVVWNDTLYVIGGVRRVQDPSASNAPLANGAPGAVYTTEAVTTIETLAAGGTAFVEHATMPWARDRFGALVANDKVWIIGGRKQCAPTPPLRPETPAEAYRMGQSPTVAALHGASWETDSTSRRRRLVSATADWGEVVSSSASTENTQTPGDVDFSAEGLFGTAHAQLLGQLGEVGAQLPQSLREAALKAYTAAIAAGATPTAKQEAEQLGDNAEPAAVRHALAVLEGAVASLGATEAGFGEATAWMVTSAMQAPTGGPGGSSRSPAALRELQGAGAFFVVNASEVFDPSVQPLSDLTLPLPARQCLGYELGGTLTVFNLNCLLLSSTYLALPTTRTAESLAESFSTPDGQEAAAPAQAGAVDWNAVGKSPQERGEDVFSGGFWTQDDWNTATAQYSENWFQSWAETVGGAWELPGGGAPVAAGGGVPLPWGQTSTGGGGAPGGAVPAGGRPLNIAVGTAPPCLDDTRDRPYTSVDVWDPSTGAWRQHNSRLRIPLMRPAVAEYAGVLYATGGQRGLVSDPSNLAVTANDAVSALQMMTAEANGEWRVDGLQFPDALFSSQGGLKPGVGSTTVSASLEANLFPTFDAAFSGFGGSSAFPRISMVAFGGKLVTPWESFDLTLPLGAPDRKWTPHSHRGHPALGAFVHLVPLQGQLIALSEVPPSLAGAKREISHWWQLDWLRSVPTFVPDVNQHFEVESLTPAVGSPLGGDEVTIVFTPSFKAESELHQDRSLRVRIGGRDAQLIDAYDSVAGEVVFELTGSQYKLRVITPVGAGVNQPVEIFLLYGAQVAYPNLYGVAYAFSYTAPEITATSPAMGSTTGGYAYTIRGRNFGTVSSSSNAIPTFETLPDAILPETQLTLPTVRWERPDHSSCAVLQPLSVNDTVRVSDSELTVTMPPGVGYGWVPRVTYGGQDDATGSAWYAANWYAPRQSGQLQAARNERPTYAFSFEQPKVLSVYTASGSAPAVGGATLIISGTNLGYIRDEPRTAGGPPAVGPASSCGYSPSTPSDRFSTRVAAGDLSGAPGAAPPLTLPLTMKEDEIILAHPAFKQKECSGGPTPALLDTQTNTVVDTFTLPAGVVRSAVLRRLLPVFKCVLPAGVGANWTVGVTVDGQRDGDYVVDGRQGVDALLPPHSSIQGSVGGQAPPSQVAFSYDAPSVLLTLVEGGVTLDTGGSSTVLVRGINFGSVDYSGGSAGGWRSTRTRPGHIPIKSIDDAIYITVGTYLVPREAITWSSDSTLRFVAPPGVGKDQVVRVCILGSCSSPAPQPGVADNTVAYAAPEVYSVSPNRFYFAQRFTDIVITGTNFGQSLADVSFLEIGGQRCSAQTAGLDDQGVFRTPNLEWVSSTTLICRNASQAMGSQNAAGQAEVLVEVGEQTFRAAEASGTGERLMRVIGSPASITISPTTGFPGDTIFISGSNFAFKLTQNNVDFAVTGVTIGGVPCDSLQLFHSVTGNEATLPTGVVANDVFEEPQASSEVVTAAVWIECVVPAEGSSTGTSSAPPPGAPQMGASVVVTTGGGLSSDGFTQFTYAEPLPAPTAPVAFESQSFKDPTGGSRTVGYTWISTVNAADAAAAEPATSFKLFYSTEAAPLHSYTAGSALPAGVATLVKDIASLTTRVLKPADLHSSLTGGTRRRVQQTEGNIAGNITQVGRREPVGPTMGNNLFNPHIPSGIFAILSDPVLAAQWTITRYYAEDRIYGALPYFFRVSALNGDGESDLTPLQGPVFDNCSLSQYLTTNLPLAQVQCAACPTGAFCGGQPAHRVVNLQGFWRAPWNPVTSFVECEDAPAACSGYDAETDEGQAYKYFVMPARVGGGILASAQLLNETTAAAVVQLGDARFDITSAASTNNASFLAAGGQSFTPVGSSASGTCAAGYSGNLCNSCQVGFARSGTATCQECRGDGENSAALVGGSILALIMVAGLTFMTLRSRGEPSKQHVGVVKILFTHVQIVAIAASFPLRWPDTVVNFMESMNAASSVSDELISPDCISSQSDVSTSFAGSTFYMRAAATIILPWVLLALLALFWYTHWACGCAYFWEEGELARLCPGLQCLDSPTLSRRRERLADLRRAAVKAGQLEPDAWVSPSEVFEEQYNNTHRGDGPAASQSKTASSTSAVLPHPASGGVECITVVPFAQTSPEGAPASNVTRGASGSVSSLKSPIAATNATNGTVDDTRSPAYAESETPSDSTLATSTPEPASMGRASSEQEGFLMANPIQRGGKGAVALQRHKSPLSQYRDTLAHASMLRVVPLRRPNKAKGCSTMCNPCAFATSDHIDLLIVSVIVTAFLIHPTLTRVTLSLFTCQSIGDSPKQYLVADKAIECNTSVSAPWAYALGVPFFIFYALGIPGAAYVALLRHRRQLHSNLLVRATYGFLFASFRPDMYFWEEVNMIRKVLFAVMAVLLAPLGIISQTMLATVVLTGFAIFHARFQPYVEKLLNRLELGSLIASLLTLQGGLYLFACDVCSDATRSAITVLILTANAVFFAQALYAFGRAFADHEAGKKQNKEGVAMEKKATCAVLFLGLFRTVLPMLCCDCEGGDDDEDDRGRGV